MRKHSESHLDYKKFHTIVERKHPGLNNFIRLVYFTLPKKIQSKTNDYKENMSM